MMSGGFSIKPMIFKKNAPSSHAAPDHPVIQEHQQIPEQELTLLKYRAEIIEKINNNAVTIINAPTGSGKTTQVPQFIFDDAKKRGETCNILISQPRKIAAITIARRVAKERNCEIGALVGYQVGLKSKKDLDEDEKTRLLFCTTGVILQKLIQERHMNNFTHIILDEVHEREVDMDLLLCIVREFLLHNSKETKVILMSATANSKHLIKYFTLNVDVIIKPAFINHKPERNFKIEKFYLENLSRFGIGDGCANFMKPGISPELYNLTKDIILERLKESQNSILIFLPGIYEIEALHSVLRDEPELLDSCVICILHSSLSVNDQRIAFMNASKPKIVLSTNIAESSVTITGPEVDCVIDFCLTKYLVANKESTMSTLKLAWAAQSNLEQRAGRTGRTCDGVVYRLVERRFYERLLENGIPEMERCPLETVILRVKMLDIGTPLALLSKTLSPPEPAAIRNAVLTLKELGGLVRVDVDGTFSPSDGDLTYVGRIMAALPVDVRIAKFIIVGYLYSVLEEAIIIGAGLNIKSIFRCSYGKKLDDYFHKLTWADGSGCDFIAILNAYKLWKHMTEQGNFANWEAEKLWCNQYNLERKNLHEMRDLIEEISNRLTDLKMEKLSGIFSVTWEEKEKPLILKICIAGAFMPNYFISGQSTEYIEQDIHKTLGGKNPLNSVYFKIKDKTCIGEVYEAQLKEKIVESGICRDTNEIKLTFDKGSSKIFVQFLGATSLIDDDNYNEMNYADQYHSSTSLVEGKIAPEVYKAVKLRKNGFHTFSLQVMNGDETEEHAISSGIGNNDLGYFQLTRNVLEQPELCVLPLTCVKSITGVVTHIEHCGKFYIQPTSKENSAVMNRIKGGMKRGAVIPYTDVKILLPDKQVIVRDGDEMKRAKIVSTCAKDQTAKCFLFDYGNTAEFPVKMIFLVMTATQQLFKIPERCFESFLSQIAPSFITCPRGKWTSKAIDEFRQLVMNHQCTVEVYSVVDDVASVKLYVEDNCINKALISAGFATVCEESYPSKMDHEIRKKNQSCESKFGPEKEFAGKLNKMLVNHVPPPPMSKCVKSLPLHGPISPLETSVSHIFLKSEFSEINIDPLSVNSVVLYDDPGNIYGRLLVAANITRNKYGTVLHETSLMPNIPGIAILLGMIFAPDLIFRRNKDKTRYVNMQFGLGFHSDDARSFFAEQDCILPVDFELDQTDKGGDFFDINLLRFMMSYLLMTQPNELLSTLSDEQKSDALGVVKKTIMKILGKSREPLSSAYLSYSYEGWEKEDQNDSMVPKEMFIEGGLYHQIPQPKLAKEDPAKIEIMLKELAVIERDIKYSTEGSIASIKTFTCPLCNREFEEKFSLQIHFSSKMHMSRRKMLKPAEK